ncbi:hypothetical protein L227DRAFT_46151 [Lentinus tigrinus ALCF2SS1-6]|uniref:Uncharacterized protein n=1 Tax=Lentinus tigrinus ALCF2SS1-6 TaxID=1328759 RepID=A0A5C2SFE8_9APHY|nr:hypothetical protein L227DRAFT_46151 [Lentinus tigrinus ALCF2SS1-6]
MVCFSLLILTLRTPLKCVHFAPGSHQWSTLKLLNLGQQSTPQEAACKSHGRVEEQDLDNYQELTSQVLKRRLGKERQGT